MLRRRSMLALMIIGVVPAFAIVNSAVSAARARRETLSAEWAHRGEIDLANGRPRAAAEDFQTADEYARTRGAYRLPLAMALIAAGRPVEAEAHLQTLWNAAPGDGVINLQLARLAAREGRIADAVRYYHAAIDGAWENGAVAARRGARLELARLLLARQLRTQAQVELVALAADPPADAAAQTDIAALLIDAGADNRALATLDSALRLDPDNGRAARLAGEATLRLGDYRRARAYLERARRTGGLDAAGADALDTVTRVLELDPYVRGIRSRERLRRVVQAFAIASAALDRCRADALAPSREERERLAREVAEPVLARDPDAVDATLTFAADTIEAARTACGPATADERALQLVFQQRRPAP